LLFSGLSEVSLFRRAEFGGRSLECWRTGRVAWAVMSVSLASLWRGRKRFGEPTGVMLSHELRDVISRIEAA
jgi:hypothetical protein